MLRTKFILLLSLLCFGIFTLTGCGGASEEDIEEASTLIHDKLVADYGQEFVIDEMNAECSGIFNSVKKFYGFASLESDPTIKFYVEMSEDKQTFKDQYICKLLEPKTESTLRAEFGIPRTYNITAEVFSDNTLIASETAINGDTVVNSSTINYNVYLIKEYTDGMDLDKEATIMSDVITKLSALSFRGMVRLYLVSSGTTDIVRNSIHGLEDKTKGNSCIIKMAEANFETKTGMGYNDILSQLQ